MSTATSPLRPDGPSPSLSRRSILHLSAVAAGAAVLAACSPDPEQRPGKADGEPANGAGGKGSATKPLDVPGSSGSRPSSPSW